MQSSFEGGMGMSNISFLLCCVLHILCWFKNPSGELKNHICAVVDFYFIIIILIKEEILLSFINFFLGYRNLFIIKQVFGLEF